MMDTALEKAKIVIRIISSREQEMERSSPSYTTGRIYVLVTI
jgi:hypothetical protein